jgi:hypothetical protein
MQQNFPALLRILLESIKHSKKPPDHGKFEIHFAERMQFADAPRPNFPKCAVLFADGESIGQSSSIGDQRAYFWSERFGFLWDFEGTIRALFCDTVSFQ